MPPLNQHKVLIVDDERLIADTLATIFRQAGYLGSAAYSAEAVLDSASTWSPNLAILDVVLPGMNGIELARCSRRSARSVTSCCFRDNLQRAICLTKIRFHPVWTALAKPAPLGELLALAAALLQ